MLVFKTKILHSIIVTAVLFVIAYGIEGLRENNQDKLFDVKRIENIIVKKQNEALRTLEKVKKQVEKEGIDSYIKNNGQELIKNYKSTRIAVVVYKNWYLRIWPENTINVPNVYGASIYEDLVVKLGNSYFVPVQIKTPTINYIALIFIKSQYSKGNKLVSDYFNPDFHLSPSVKVSLNDTQGYKIADRNGNYLFSLKLNSNNIVDSSYYWIIILFFLAGIVSLLRIVIVLFNYKKVDNNYFIYLFFTVFFIVVLRGIMIKFHIPNFLYQFEIFRPEYLSISLWNSSVGDFLFNSILLLFIVLLVYKKVSRLINLNIKNIRLQWLFIGFMSCIVIFLNIGIEYLFKSLIINSTLEFQPFKILSISIFSILTYLGLLIHIFVYLVLIAWIYKFLIKLSISYCSVKWFNIIYLSLASLLAVFNVLSVSTIISFFVLNNIMVIHLKAGRGSISFIVTLSVVLSLFSTLIIHYTNDTKEVSKMKLIAENLTVSQDYYAEARFQEISNNILQDSYIDTLITESEYSKEELYSYLRRGYFNNYLEQYKFNLLVCHPNDSIFVENSANQWQHCRTFYSKKVHQEGIPLFKSNYYYMGNNNGKILYLGIHDLLLSNHKKVSLIIELESKISGNLGGFSRLTNASIPKSFSYLSQYSYAKFSKNGLVSKYGKCPYRLNIDFYNKDNLPYRVMSSDGYRHVIITTSENQTIIVSSKVETFFQLIINFLYFFVFVFIMAVIISVIRLHKLNKLKFRNSISVRIQLFMVGLLFLSLLLIGGGAIYFIYQNYDDKNTEIIEDKLHSVITELQSRFNNQESFDNVDISYLEFLLQKYSKTFNSDISIYSLDGDLIVSSRPELFKQEFLSSKMDLQSYIKLHFYGSSKIIQKEEIGNLKYYSGYIPILNQNNKELGYINLPFFSNENLLSEDISSIIVAFVNVYVLLILLAVVVTIFLSNNVTKPLQLLRDKLSGIDLKKHNTPIDFDSKDEIGLLVQEYNRMVTELSENVDLMAKQERESAWRSMARQVAHEIKNPLTPMKLSVQLMLRAWYEQRPDFEQRLKSVSDTLIKQIDTLSNIASEFSTFAKMPTEQIETVEINQIISSLSTLFDEYKNVIVNLYVDKNEKFYILADTSRIVRLFNNLIKNAIQAIPENRQGEITLKTEKVKNNVLITITDNGDGIPEEIKDQLFQPNFTTKTKGMGLGLAMVKNIVKGFNGNITFKTQSGIGTSFFVEFPLVEKS